MEPAAPPNPNFFVFCVEGAIDLSTAAELQVDLDEAIGCHEGDLVVDCGGLTFIDSRGLAVLVETQRTLDALGRELRVVNVDYTIERLFAVMGLREVLHVNDVP